jgi:putative nucleotidyltransferase with HDIG domain
VSPDLDQARQRFEAFVQETLDRLPPERDTQPMLLKREHSLFVLENATAILDGLGATGDIRELTLTAALYHDVGRFPQYERFQTFKDSLSVNHGLLGSQVLRNSGLLEGADPRARRLIRGAVCLHNRMLLPRKIRAPLRFMARVLRDADKIDITRVMLEHFNLPEGNPVVALHVRPHPTAYTPAVYDKVWQARRGDYRELRWVNDFKLMLCGWVHDLNFAPSRLLLVERGLFDHLLATLPDTEPMRRLAGRLHEILEQDMRGKEGEAPPEFRL